MTIDENWKLTDESTSLRSDSILIKQMYEEGQ